MRFSTKLPIAVALHHKGLKRDDNQAIGQHYRRKASPLAVFASARAKPPESRNRVTLKNPSFIALYSFCAVHPDRKIAAPLLVLAGIDDDWIPSARCQQLEQPRAPSVAAPRVKIYAKAGHLFEAQQPLTVYLGHHLACNKETYVDAHAQIRNFLSATFP